ncbi:SGNH/GDSL hydrolase family protein [Lysobacter yangpyeongensis]|uniref:SGNH/GDSL hydrolase family protein n=1 Tax=Lysobacter yangpyeongensis TaxID=346182 RepID=A0ABW0SPE8_9GAMM
MRGAIGVVVLLVALLLPSAALAGTTLRVLFVGNSLTYYNDLPSTFATLYQAAAPDARIETELLAQGGGRLRERLQDGVLAKLLAEHRYDVVVLQELGGLPLCPDDFPSCRDAPAALRESVELVRAHGARAVWFATWQASPEAQRELSLRVRALSHSLQLETVDIGAMLQRVSPTARTRLLHDDGHPDYLGTWLIAAALVDRLAQAPLPDSAPPSCGWQWRDGALDARRPASQQTTTRAPCHHPDDTQWRALRAAIHP